MSRPIPKSVTDTDYDLSNKLLIFGGSNTGKTHLLATIGGNGLLLDIDKGLKTLKGVVKNKKGQFNKKQHKKLVSNIKKIQAIKCNNHTEVIDAVDWLKRNKSKYDWIALDNITETAEISLETEFTNFKDGRLAYKAMNSAMYRLIRSMRDDLTKQKIIILARQYRIQDEDTGKTMYKPSMPNQSLSNNLEGWFDEVFCARINSDFDMKTKEETKEYFLQCNRTRDYFAKDRDGSLNIFERPNLNSIFKKIG